MKRIIFLVLFLIVAFFGWYAYTEYNRKNVDLLNKKADVITSATALIAAFEKDTASANKKYVDKIIEVSGTVKSIDTNGNPVVIALGEKGKMSSVQCSMDSTHASGYTSIKEGEIHTVKGICAGGKTEDLFGTDVFLNRCIMVNKK